MDVTISFDVEDIVHPDSDDIALDIATMLADEGIIASMYITGDKARIWERRGRTDVISAIAQHDVGLHTDHHSIHPTVSEYLQDKNWTDGVDEAIRQESPGVCDLTRLFGRYPSAWATSGSSWGPQIPAATRAMGIPVHAYCHVRSGDSGACWFAGQLCLTDVFFYPGDEDTYADSEQFDAVLPAFLESINAAQRQGMHSACLFGGHPTRLRYIKFWDTLNFARGQNTDPAAYRQAPRRSEEDYQTSLRNLLRLILAVRDLPGVCMTSTYATSRRFAGQNISISWQELCQLAQQVLDTPVINAENPLASPAQTLDLLARGLLRTLEGKPPAYLLQRTVLGPTEPPPNLEKILPLPVDQVAAIARTLVAHIDQTGHLPSALLAGETRIGPGAMMRAFAAALLSPQKERVAFTPGAEEPAIAASLVQSGIYARLPNWTPHAPDLRLDLLALHTRLQTWSLKPAVFSS